jgi:N-acetylglutamate synthase-like GNAT family acetyltransferase
MSDPFRIDVATIDDLEKIKEMLESIEEPTDDLDPDLTRIFVIRNEEDDNLIGCIALEIFTGTALLRSFAMDQTYSGDEIWSRLIKQLLDDAFDHGSEAVYVCAKNAPSFFWGQGFKGIDLDDVPEEIRKSKLFTENCPQVAAFVKRRAIR